MYCIIYDINNKYNTIQYISIHILYNMYICTNAYMLTYIHTYVYTYILTYIYRPPVHREAQERSSNDFYNLFKIYMM
jgi:hypothetical protein